MSRNTYSQKFIDACRDLYVQDGISLHDIAERHNHRPTERTLQRWAEADKWDEKRDDYRMSKRSIEQSINKMIEEQIQAILDKPLADRTPGDFDAIAKLNKTRKTFEKQMSAPEAFSILQPIIREFNEDYENKDEVYPLFQGPDCYWRRLADYIWRKYPGD